jgi:subtilisin family serine protease
LIAIVEYFCKEYDDFKIFTREGRMSKLYRMIVLFVVAMLVVSCAAPITVQPVPSATSQPASSLTAQPSSTSLPEEFIVRHPGPADDIVVGGYYVLPTYNPESEDPLQIDLRSRDVSKLDFSDRRDDLLYATFDSRTQWPPITRMPIRFNWSKIMEVGKDPGLGVRDLHRQGITGNGVNIAIIDQTLLLEHIEYANQIRLYDEINIMADEPSAMHGPAVSSIAVGKTVGVAPEANLYYIAAWPLDLSNPSSQNLDFSYLAQAVRRIIEINEQLPEGQKIRVISMSQGFPPTAAGYDDIIAAIQEARDAGIFVISVSLDDTYGWHFLGMERDPLSDPNDFRSYKPAYWLQDLYFTKGFPPDTLWVPMGSRTTASQTGVDEYAYYRLGGMSWAVPYLAGMYALAAQVKPDITPEEFWNTALQTGKTIQLQHDGKGYEFGVILDPQALIKALQSE